MKNQVRQPPFDSAYPDAVRRDDPIADSDRLVLRPPRGGFATAFGLVLILLGALFIWLVAAGVRDVEALAPRIILVGLFGTAGAAMALVGLAALTARRMVVIDRGAGEVRSTVRFLFIAGRTTARRMDEFDAVSFDAESTGGHGHGGSHGGGGGPEYPVRLVGRGDPVELETFRDLLAARRRAEHVAQFLDLPLRDLTTPHATERDAAALDQPLAQRLRESARRDNSGGDTARAKPPQPPKGGRIRHEAADGRAMFELPPFSARRAGTEAAGLLTLTAMWSAGIWFGLAGIAWTWRLAAIGVVSLAAWTAAAWFLQARERVSLSREHLCVERRWAFLVRRRTMRVDQLEELRVIEGEIAARGDAGELKFGASLESSERRWLVRTIEHFLEHGA